MSPSPKPTTVLVGGKFNIIHPGHRWLLRRARRYGDRLVVVLAHQRQNKRVYAKSAAARKRQLKATGLVDTVVIGHAHDFFKVVKKTKPSVIVLGYDQKLPPGVKDKLVNIRIVKFKRHGTYATRNMHQKLSARK